MFKRYQERMARLRKLAAEADLWASVAAVTVDRVKRNNCIIAHRAKLVKYNKTRYPWMRKKKFRY